MTNLVQRLYKLCGQSCTQDRFRDPGSDFGVSVTNPQALDRAPRRMLPDVPFVSEHGVYVSLYPGGIAGGGVHAIMDRTVPSDLVLSYTQIMAGFARFVQQPTTIGMIGLGGGSLVKYCSQVYPDAHIQVAEISPEVIGLRRRFLIPEDNERLCVLQQDGAELVSSSPNAFDVLLVDAFDEAGYPPRLGTQAFYMKCHASLTRAGVLVLNFSGRYWYTWFRRVDRIFRGQCVLYQCPDGDNVIVFATRGRLPAWTRQPDTSRP